jgi:hypothetical protein
MSSHFGFQDNKREQPFWFPISGHLGFQDDQSHKERAQMDKENEYDGEEL